jgi:hypothetical protein
MVFDSEPGQFCVKIYHDAGNCQEIESKTINPPLRN